MKFLQIILPLIQKDGSFFALFGNVDFLLFVWFSYCSLNECKVLRAKILKWEYVMRRGGLQKICTSLCTIACFLNQRLWSYSRKSFLGKSPIVFYIVNGWGPKEPKEGAISGQNAFSNCCLYWSHPFQHFAKFQNRWLKKQAIVHNLHQLYHQGPPLVPPRVISGAPHQLRCAFCSLATPVLEAGRFPARPPMPASLWSFRIIWLIMKIQLLVFAVSILSCILTN